MQSKTRGSSLLKAHETINGERQQMYGSPEDSFTQIAKMWSAYTDTDFTPHDVAMMMALMKVARIKNGSAVEDSYVDGAAYLALAYDMEMEEKND